ncbi:MAG: protein kinase, partial [Planctomycetes bacterium]|nr:protein kinase [Planctomycetota bacterium]
PYYIAPECLSGREPDVRSDLYSLGVVFYEMLTGKVPFGGESPTAIFRGHLYEIPVPIGELAPEISLRVANVAYRCIEKNPSARYQTCEELLADLDAVVAEWSRDRDTQRRQQQAVELALTLGMEKKRPPSRGLGRIVALVMVLASLVALLLVALNAFRAFPTASLPPGSHAGDRVWAPGGSARVFGTLVAVDDGGDSPRVFLTLRRVRVSGAPAVRAALPRDAWERLGDKARPRPGDALFCQGRVAEAGGVLELQVPGFGSVRAPGAPKTGVMQEGRFLSFPPATLADLPARTRVRVYGWVLARSDLGAGGSALLLGDGRGPDFEVRISPDPLVRSLDVRVGDYVETEGESAGVEGPRVVVENGVLLNVEAFGSPGAADEPR